jgi:hypothetical protein
MPTAIKNVVKAYQMATTGESKDSKGKLIQKVDGWDAAIKFIGFQPTDVATSSAKISEAMKDIEIAKYAKSDIADRIAQSILEDKPSLRTDAIRDLAEWNKNNPEMRISLTASAITSRVKEARLTRDQRTIKRAPPGLRAEVMADLR